MATREASAPSIAGPRRQTRLSYLRAGALYTALEQRLEQEREQLPLWIAVALLMGISAWFVLPTRASWTGFLLLTAGSACAAAVSGWNSRTGRTAAIFAAVAALGCALIWWRSEHVAAPRLERPTFATLQAEIVATELLPARDSVRFLLRPAADAGLPPLIRVSIDEGDHRPQFRTGARIALRARLMPPAQQALPGAYDFARVAWFQSIGGTGRALGAPTLVSAAQETGAKARLERARQRLSAHIQQQVEGPPGAIAATLATGDRGALPEEDAEAMRRSGLAHLLSISGLHVTAVVAAAMLLTIRLLALSPRLALRWPLVLIGAVAGAAAGVGYTLFTGAEVPTVRSCAAALLVLAGIAMGRDAITLRLVATGAIIVMLMWPEAVVGPSFQLSFAAVTAIVALHEHPRVKALLARREEGMGRRLGRGLLTLLLTGLAVEITLSPIALYHFHKSGLYGALANIVAIPLTTFIIMPAEAAALLLDSVGLGRPFWWLAGNALALLLWLAHTTANAPGAVAMLPTMPRGAFGLMVGGGLWLLLWRTGWRRWGTVPVAAGAIWALATPAPDLLITGDGRHLAVRTDDERMAILRSRAGDYVRDMLGESAGSDEEMLGIEDLPGAACSPDLCAVEIVRNGRTWRLLATRSGHFVPWREMVQACNEADVVVADRRLPAACVPRWLKVDRFLLARTGGLSIRLGTRPVVSTVADAAGDHPWSLLRSGAAEENRRRRTFD